MKCKRLKRGVVRIGKAVDDGVKGVPTDDIIILLYKIRELS